MNLVQPSEIASVQRKWKAYPAYKNSGAEWLGKVPAHWNIKKLKYLFRVVNGSTPKSTEGDFWDGEIPWVTPEDLGALSDGTIRSTARYITEAGYQSCGTSLVPAGSLVLSTRAPIGHLAIAGVELCTNQGCRSLVFQPGLNRKFFFYQLLAARNELQSLGQGSTFQELGKGKLEAISLVVPPPQEQQAIADFLDRETEKLDALVKKKERLIELLQEKRTAIISQTVTKGLDPNVPMKDSGIEWLGEIPVHWEVKRLKFLTVNPLQYGANEAGLLADPDQPRFVRITDITENGELREDTFRSLPHDVARPFLLSGGDLLLARSGATVGKSFMYKDSWGACCYAGYLIRARLLTTKILPEFINYFAASTNYWDWISASIIQATIQNVSAEKYGNLSIPLPGLEQQRRIIVYLDRETAKIDALSDKVREGIEKLKEYRTALISAAVTGKIDVRAEFPGNDHANATADVT